MNELSPTQLSLRVPERIVPLPEDASPQLQEAIAKTEFRRQPLPSTNEGFNALRGNPEERERAVLALAADLNVRLKLLNVAGVSCFQLTPEIMPPRHLDRILVHLHEGGYVCNAGVAGAAEAVSIAVATATQVLSIDYRMPPDCPYPAAINDILFVWKEITARKVATGLVGTSSGGGLVLSVAQHLLKIDLPAPRVLVAGTPWSDLSKTGDSYYINDLGLGGYEDGLDQMARLYAGGLGLRDPRISPVYGEFAGFPPTLLISGTRDLFLSNTVRVDQRLRDVGATSKLIVYEGQGHAAYLDIALPESGRAYEEMARFIDEHIACP